MVNLIVDFAAVFVLARLAHNTMFFLSQLSQQWGWAQTELASPMQGSLPTQSHNS